MIEELDEMPHDAEFRQGLQLFLSQIRSLEKELQHRLGNYNLCPLYIELLYSM